MAEHVNAVPQRMRTSLAWRHQHRVDHVNRRVGGRDAAADQARVVDLDVVAMAGHGQGRALEVLCEPSTWAGLS